MLVDVTRHLTDFSGKESDVSLRDAVIQLVRQPLEGDAKLSEKEKTNLFTAGCKVATQDKPDLTVEEISALKHRFDKHGSILGRGRVLEMLDPPGLAAVESESA